MLGYIDPDVPYDQWLRVLMALHDAGDHMLPLAVEWSKRGEKYRPGEIERKWKGFKHKRKGFTRGTGVTWRTVPELPDKGAQTYLQSHDGIRRQVMRLLQTAWNW